MTFFRGIISSSAVAIAMTSCAQPADQVSVKKIVAVPATKPKLPEIKCRGVISEISLSELFALQQSDQVLLYDVRPRFFYNLGHLPSAISLPKSTYDAQISQHQAELKAALGAHKTLVVYCTNLTCPDAGTVATRLADLGISCSILTGGWEAWKQSGLTTESF